MMSLIDGQSLYRTVMNAANFMFEGGSYTPSERSHLVDWILAHQTRQRGFVFYPTAAERECGIRLFSGEKPQTVLATNNAVEMETLRLLALLQPDAPEVQRLFEMAERRLSGVCFGRVCSKGECAHASLSVLRYHTARGVERGARMIVRGLEALRQDRVGEGKWRCFPFYYALLWLVELPDSLPYDELDECVRAELLYARDRCGRLLSRLKPRASGKPFDRVRSKILQDALIRVARTAATQGVMFEVDRVAACGQSRWPLISTTLNATQTHTLLPVLPERPAPC